MKNKMIGWWILAGILALVLAGLIIFYFNYNSMVVRVNKPKTDTKVTPTATPTPDPLAAYSILLMGYGGGNHEGGLLTDSIMLAKFESKWLTV